MYDDNMRSVYIRRRVAVLCALVIIIVLIIWAVSSIVSCVSGSSENPDVVITNSGDGSNANSSKKPVKVPSMNLICTDNSEMVVGTAKLGIVAKCGEDNKHLIASVTKAITAMVILNDVNNDLTALSQRIMLIDGSDIAHMQAIEAEEGTTLPLVEGQELDEATALKGMLLASANNVVDALVIHHFGSMENYLATAQKWVDENNLSSRVELHDASGLDDTTLVSGSALFEVGQKIVANPVLMSVVSLDEVLFPDAYLGYDYEIPNVMNNLHSVGFNGIKTGYTFDAGRTLLGSKVATNVDDTIIVVTLGDQNDANGFSYLAAQEAVNSLNALLTAEYYQ